jgi:hypothetical protein
MKGNLHRARQNSPQSAKSLRKFFVEQITNEEVINGSKDPAVRMSEGTMTWVRHAGHGAGWEQEGRSRCYTTLLLLGTSTYRHLHSRYNSQFSTFKLRSLVTVKCRWIWFDNHGSVEAPDPNLDWWRCILLLEDWSDLFYLYLLFWGFHWE